MKSIALGLLLLQQSYDGAVDKIVQAAEKADTAPAKVGIGDEFTKLLPKFPKKRQEVLDAASLWYWKAWPDLDDPWKAKLRERLAALYRPVVPAKPGGQGWWGGAGEARCERVHSGGRALRILPRAGKLASVLQVPVEIPAGKAIELSLWASSDGTDSPGDKIKFQVTAKDGKELFVRELSIPPDSPAWVRLSVKPESIEGATRAVFEVLLASGKGTVWLDDLSVLVDGKEAMKGGGVE